MQGCRGAAAAAASASNWRSASRFYRSGAVLEPASGTFDVTVAPGEDVQAAVDACPPGGSVLLLPGTHAGPLVLLADKEVHVFGRGHATLRTASGTAVVTSEAAVATCDGLVIHVTRSTMAAACLFGAARCDYKHATSKALSATASGLMEAPTQCSEGVVPGESLSIGISP